MGEYEPHDSRNVTQSTHRAPGEPPRTGPREDEARAKAERERAEKDARAARDEEETVEADESSVPLGN